MMKQSVKLEEKIKTKNECVDFYHKSIGIFQGNVRDKLKSLVENIDFSQL